MLVADFDQMVRETDQSAHLDHAMRRDIAAYGLVGEIASVLTAAKKQLLAEGGDPIFTPTSEVREELGDVVWYCFSLAQVVNTNIGRGIFNRDISQLRREISRDDERSAKIREALGEEKVEAFMRASADFPRIRNLQFGDYQSAAFLTARTDGLTLFRVCMSVLWQLGAQLLRANLPPIELDLNTSVQPKSDNQILSEIAWHVSAVATLYGLSLDDLAEENARKVRFRGRGPPTERHDRNAPNDQRFPARFEVTFITIGHGRSRMYLNGRQLGDDLTDNAYDDDGYRFHDAFHLANAAKLAWSPVLRSLLRKKRKYRQKLDEVEDGARARIVEEAIVKLIHTEGERLAAAGLQTCGRKKKKTPIRLFTNRDEITFRFLKTLRPLMKNLEVEENQHWEWVEAITEGHSIYHKLRVEEQGTVTVDIENRTIDFSPLVYPNVSGAVVGVGTAAIQPLERRSTQPAQRRVEAAKLAILAAIGIESPSRQQVAMIDVIPVGGSRVSVKTRGTVRSEIWRRKIVMFRTTFMEISDGVSCTALAIVDPRDALAEL